MVFQVFITDEFAFESMCISLIDVNFPLLILKMLSQWFPNSTSTPQKLAWLNRKEPMLLSFSVFCNAKIIPFQVDCNLSTTLCMLRILQKLTKISQSRILFLITWKSTYVLKRILRHLPAVCTPKILGCVWMDVVQTRRYVCKLCKLQIPFLGKKWKLLPSNLLVISEISRMKQACLVDEYLVEAEMDIERGKTLEMILRARVAKYRTGLESRGCEKRELVELGKYFLLNYESWVEEVVDNVDGIPVDFETFVSLD